MDRTNALTAKTARVTQASGRRTPYCVTSETMFPRSVFPLVFVAVSAPFIVSIASCSDDASDAGNADASTSPHEDGGASSEERDDSGTNADAGDEPDVDVGPTATEVEPNNGATDTEVGSMVIPGTMKGAIDPANDVDVFSIALSPGDFWEWTATPTTGDLAPHIIVFDTAGGLNPNVASFAGAGAKSVLQHFVLNQGTFVVAVRDARNVGMSGHQGGPNFTYSLSAKRRVPAPIPVTFPTTKTGTLATVGSVDLYTFNGTNGKGFDIVVNAERKALPSTLDSRLSLFDLTTKKWLITNDNLKDSTDSQVGSDDASGDTFMVIVENEGTNPADLSYEITFTNR